MGAGKTTCAELMRSTLSKDGVSVEMVDADTEAKKLMRSDTSIRKKLGESFGESVVNHGEIVFSSLGTLAFGSKQKLIELNGIVHPLLLERIEELIFSRDSGCVICDAALIPQWHIEEWFDVLFWVQSPFEERRERLVKKAALTKEEITARMLVQQDLFPEPVDVPWKIISNRGTIEELRLTVQSLCASLGLKE